MQLSSARLIHGSIWKSAPLSRFPNDLAEAGEKKPLDEGIFGERTENNMSHIRASSIPSILLQSHFAFHESQLI
jgi:hypothetical protein